MPGSPEKANVSSKEEGSQASRGAAGLGHCGWQGHRHEIFKGLAAICVRPRLRRLLTTPPTLAARAEEPWRCKRFAPFSLFSGPTDGAGPKLSRSTAPKKPSRQTFARWRTQGSSRSRRCFTSPSRRSVFTCSTAYSLSWLPGSWSAKPSTPACT